MENKRYKVTLWVDVEGFDEDDCFDTLMDNFGIGPAAPGITIVESEWTFKKG